MRVSLPNLHLTGPLVFCEVLLGAHDKCYHKDVNVLNIVFGADIWRKKLHMVLYIWFSTLDKGMGRIKWTLNFECVEPIDLKVERILGSRL